MVEIRLSVGASELILRSCSHCETKWWERDGELVKLDNVLSAAAIAE